MGCSRPLGLLLVLACAACTHGSAPPAPTLSSASPLEAVSRPPELRVTLRAPSRAPYDPDALGLGGQSVGIRVENIGSRAVRLAPVRVRFSATREGVVFPCHEHVEASFRGREPRSLAPGQSFVFERDIDCVLPLPGSYEIAVAAHIADDDPSAGGPVGTFRLELEAGHHAPRAVPSRAGLFAIMSGARATRPMTPEAWARGDYRVVVGVINGSSRPVAVGPARLAFLVYRTGSPLPCSGRAEPLALPAELPPGTMHVVQAPIACAPSAEGKYEIVGRLSLGEDGEPVEIGRIGLRVTSDPAIFVPLPWTTK